MKKIFALLMIPIFALLLVACEDKKMPQEGINVYFFTANDGAEKKETIFDVEPGSKIEKPEDPVRPGFIFIEWTTDYEGSNPWDFDNDVVGNESVILFAQWEDLILTVSYNNLLDGRITSSSYVEEFRAGQTPVLPVARRTGYTFKGWYEYAPDFDRYPNTDGTRPGEAALSAIPSTRTTDLVLYAHWRIITVSVTFRANHPGGTSVVSNPPIRSYAYDTIVVYGDNFPTFDELEGYQFVEWNTRADGSGDSILDNEMFGRTQPTTVYGIWIEA